MVRVTRRIAGAGLAMGCVVGVVIAGDITPPAGPVSETMKTLVEVEPRIAVNATNTPGDADSVYRIAAPGSYYLTDNVVAGAGEHGIEIASSDVSLDLSGFRIVGDQATSLVGVHADGAHFSIEIHNGTIVGFSNGGVGTTSGGYIRSRIHDLRVTNTNGIGIALGSRNTVYDCTLDANDLGGILATHSARVENCTVTNTFNGAGIEIGDSGMVQGSVANFGQAGIVVGQGSSVNACEARSNANNGITAGKSSAVRESEASNNGGHGVEINTYGQAINCTANENGLSGIRSLNRGRVEGCAANENNQHGVHITFAGSVENCFLNGNDVNGIDMDAGGVVTIRNNTISESVVGIDVTNAGGCHIEGNSVTVCSARGINVGTLGNVIVRNYCEGNPAGYVIVAGNLFGPVVTAATIGGATNPHANYLD